MLPDGPLREALTFDDVLLVPAESEVLPKDVDVRSHLTAASVLYDAVALILSPEGTEQLVKEAAARDFVADAFAHCKFIAHVDAAKPLLDKVAVEPDEGVMPLGSADDIAAFIESCRKLRLWAREQKVKL